MSQVAAGSAAHALLPVPSDPTRVGQDWLDTLEQVPLFDGLSKRHLRRIAKLAHIRRFAPGSVMVRTGDTGRSFYVLLDGSAKVTRTGRRSLRLEAGAFFGEMALIDDSPRSADVVAEGEVLALTIDRSGFAKLLRAEPALAQALLRTLAARLRAVEAAV
jgi:CRP/FNR family transcriptional regulator, cyclic AMP receptor protein